MPAAHSRLFFIDALKAIASQLILLHHLAFYGPLSDAARQAIPTVFDWLARDARIAVQVFLVIGGFLAAQSLAPAGVLRTPRLFEQVKRRYFKLVVPFLGAVFVSIVLSAIARQLFIDDAIPAAPTLLQVLAHAALLHGVLGVDSLSAGVWYIAIDFQLFVLLLFTLWLARWRFAEQAGRAAVVLVCALVLLSLFFFNRHPNWDNWALYFIGAYGLGTLTYWNSKSKYPLAGLSMLAVIVAIALFVDFRTRILVALITALSLGLAQHVDLLAHWPKNRWLAWLGTISYAVFLIHFPIILVANGIYARIAPSESWVSLGFVALTWITSLLAGAIFYRHVECPASRWLKPTTN